MMAARTNSQKMAQEAYERVRTQPPTRELASFAREFPSLIHACGLAQAIAFAAAKHHDRYLDDLAAVLAAIGHTEAGSRESLADAARQHPLPDYLRLSRNALQAAGWLKRYVQALEEE